ncbi:uncharacterized protein LOC131597533 [Vicia villosa]|uniref:uncharacterized protein LOC131597533 n=1 Tax=Vicia villosa TaxID=3911 RepID=UPI00273B6392|nr:uncharacterized protein LOC131597533 [Vicia villosa]
MAYSGVSDNDEDENWASDAPSILWTLNRAISDTLNGGSSSGSDSDRKPCCHNKERDTNYIDFGFELQTSVDDAIAANSISDSTFQIGASWQANKNFLLKAKVGPKSSTMVVAFKSWWKPSFTFNISATRDRADGQLQYGFGLQSESLREASYQRADPNFVMLTPSKEHLAEGIVWQTGKRPMLQSDIDAGHFDGFYG